MLLDKRSKDIERDFSKRLPLMEAIKKELEEGLRKCKEEEAMLMKALYAYLPLSDIANYSFEIFLDYVTHGIFLLKNSCFTEEIPAEIFFNYVLHPRINNEDIVPCRSFFYQELIDRVKGKSMEEAVLEVNHWCHEQVTYQISDSRTANALTVYNRGLGRCGEESVFTVAVLRSLGIPARQVYVPRWSHCDDNHAWVEAYVSGKWRFLGACEPEAVLDRGWFVSAASRAILVHSKLFSRIYPQGELIAQQGAVTYFNETSRYAKTKEVSIRVIDENNNGTSEAVLDLQVLNEGELHSIAKLITDKQGRATITLGFGSIYLQAVKGENVCELILDTREQQEVIIPLYQGAVYSSFSFDFLAPKSGQKPVALEKDAKAKNTLRRKAENALRNNKVEISLKEALGQLEEADYPISERVKRLLSNSGENYKEIIAFLARNKDEKERRYKEELLEALSIKDLGDVKDSILQEHYEGAIKYQGSCPDQVLIRYLMNPRILNEPITTFRSYIMNYFTKEQQEDFKKNPQVLWDFIKDNIKERDEEEFEQLVTTPMAALKLGYGSLLSKKILFIAICRTLGMPALLNSLDLSPVAYSNGDSINITESSSERRCLRISWQGKISPTYYKHWTLARWEKDSYHTLDFKGLTLTKGILSLSLEKGRYRVITTNRLLNGNQLAEIYYVDLTDEDKDLVIEVRETETFKELQNILLPEFFLKDYQGHRIQGSSITSEKTKVLIWLEVGKEPTEHILNEIYLLKDRYETYKKNLIFILKNKEEEQNQTLAKVLKKLEGIEICYDDFDENLELLARGMFIDGSQLPVIIITGGSLKGAAAFGGYNVGLGDKVLQIIDLCTGR